MILKSADERFRVAVGTVRCAVPVAAEATELACQETRSGTRVPPALRAGTAQRAVPTTRGWLKGLALAILLGWVPAQAAGTGTLDQVSGWYPLGTSLTIHALPGNNSVFAAWLGDTNGATQAGPQITLAVNSSLAVTGLFSSFPNANTQPRPAPSLIVSGKSLILIVTNGVPNGGWVLLQSSNLQLPLNQWQTNGTGTYDGSGNLATNLVNTVTHPAGFYILKF